MNEPRPQTNAALGLILGVSHAMISRYRGGDRTPGPETMLKISRLMSWPVEEQIEAAATQKANAKDFSWRDGFLAREMELKKGPGL